MNAAREDDDRRYQVVRNDEEQYSIWPSDGPTLRGWAATGFTGTRAECLAHIAEVWTDMRPRSLRAHLAHTATRTTGSPGQ